MFYRRLTKILTLHCVVCFIVILNSALLAEAGGIYHVSRWDEEIVVNEDASLTICEEVTFCFVTGDFGYAYRTIPHKGFDDMISVSVTDDKGNSLEYNLKKGSYYEVRWEWERIYVGSEPIEKTFVFNYTLTNAMNYENTDPETDRLYLNIVTDYDVDIHNVDVEVRLPGIYNLGSISATSYYSISSTNPPNIVNSTTYTIVGYHQPMSRLQAGEDYTLDIYFPATVERPPPTMTETIKVYLDALAPWYSVGMIVLGIAAVVRVRSFKRRFRDPEVSTVGILGDQPPTDIGPPEADVLSDMKVWRKHFDSALLDLSQRGYLDMHVRAREVGVFRKSVDVESFEVTLSEKGRNALQSEDPDLKRYERSLLNGISNVPINKKELSKITNKDVREKFGLELIRDELVEKGMVAPKGFEKKGANLMIIGMILALLGAIVTISYVFVGSSNWWMCITTFFPAIALGLARTTGPRTTQGAEIHRQTKEFLERKMMALKEEAKSSPISTIQQINELTPWLVLHPTFYLLVKAPNKAMKNLDTTGKQHMDILPGYIKVIGSNRLTMSPYYYNYSLWCTFYATTSPSTGAPPSGGGAGGGGAGGGAGGGGGGAG